MTVKTATQQSDSDQNRKHPYCDLQRIESDTCNTITTAEVSDSPFPYIYLENLLPTHFYDQMLEHLPNKTHYSLSSNQRTGNVRAQTYRRRFYFREEERSTLNPEQRETLSNLWTLLNGSAFTNAILSKFQPYLHLRRDLRGDIKIRIRTELVSDDIGYGIGPHTDAPNKLITLLLYLPTGANRFREYWRLGTSIYQPKDRDFTCWESNQYSTSLFDKVKTFDYRPNCALAFLKTDRSFHGVEIIEKMPAQRDTLNWQIMI